MTESKFTKIKKRDGRVVNWDQNKITTAIIRALIATGQKEELAEDFSDKVVLILNEKFAGKIPEVEQIQDAVEEVFKKEGLLEVALAYHNYRQKRTEIREAKWWLLNHQVRTKLSANALRVLESRYLKKNELGKIIETPQQLFRRVAQNIASAEKIYNPELSEDDVFRIEEKFYRVMASLDFLPNSPTLMNAGNVLQQLSACFVLPIKDSLDSIFDAVKNSALIHQSGGGTGFSFTRLRPRGDLVKSTKGVASGPISFMTVFDAATNIIKQGGCIDADSLVRTTNGVKPFGAFLDCPLFGDNPSRELIYTNGEFQRAFLAQDNGMAEVLKIKTKIGTEIKSTANHQIGVINEKGEFSFKEVAQVKGGDWIIHVLGGHVGKDKKLFPQERVQHFNATKIKIPSTMNHEFAELLGIFMADGCMNNGRIIFAIEDKDIEVKERVKKLMENLFGIQNSHEEKKKKREDGSICLVFHSHDLVRYLRENIIDKKGAKYAYVPSLIFESSAESAKSFVRGLFEGDGTIHQDGYPVLNSVSERLVTEVQQLLFGLNIISSIHKGRENLKNHFGKLPIYTLTIVPQSSVQRFQEEIGFITTRKNNLLANRNKNKIKAFESFDVIPNQGQLLRQIYDGPGRGCGKNRSSRGANRKIYRAIQHYLSDIHTSSCRMLPRQRLKNLMLQYEELKVPQLLKVSQEEYFYSQVQEISKEACYTMDIMVPEVGHFVANSILVHNKRRGANMGILRVDHPDIMEFITAKHEEGILSNFNISVAVTDEFMEKARKDEDYNLINPRTGQVWGTLNAKTVFDLITRYAWETGDPGVIFIDRINEQNPTPKLGEIESTNPCVTGDTLISTENGLERMENLYKKFQEGKCTSISTDDRTLPERLLVPQEVLVANRSDAPSNILNCRDVFPSNRDGVTLRPTTKFYNNGVKPILKLITDCGYELKATPDHKFLTPNGWVQLKDLKVGDVVYLQSGEGNFSKNKTLNINFSKINKYRNTYNFPREWSRALGQILGWLSGDGWLRSGDKDCRVGFTFSQEDKAVLDYFKPILNQWYGKEIKEVQRENGVYHLSYHGKGFVEFFEQLGVLSVDGAEKKVPESIFTAPKESVIGYLQGFFGADGTVNFSPPHCAYVRLTSKSIKLIKDSQLLLINLGIKSRIYDRSRKPRMLFPYLSKSGEKRLYLSDGKCYELNIARANTLKFFEKINFLCGKNNLKIEKFYSHRFYKDQYIDKIKCIRKAGKAVVYDLTEPITLSLTANGICVLDCGEQPLLPYESCNLGSINLEKMLRKQGEDKWEVDWQKLRHIIHMATRFLDNVIEVNRYPFKEIEEMTKGNRKIGLGVMGLADMLIRLEIPYSSKDALQTAERIMEFIQNESKAMSRELAKERGPFPNFRGSIYDIEGAEPLRNATTTTIAPTGTIGIIASCSSGIEPLFAVSFTRKHVLGGEEMAETNPLFEEMLNKKNMDANVILEKAAGEASIQEIEEIPKEVRKIFVTAFDITPEDHVKMQAAFQKYSDNAVSKTINFPYEASEEDIRRAYFLAFDLRCKGITVFRTGSRQQQVLNIKTKDQKELPIEKTVPETEVSPELRDPSPELPDLPPGSCPTCNI